MIKRFRPYFRSFAENDDSIANRSRMAVVNNLIALRLRVEGEHEDKLQNHIDSTYRQNICQDREARGHAIY
jgi:hypothetical protein